MEADIEQAHNEAVPEATLQVASCSSGNNRYKKFLNKVDLIVVDSVTTDSLLSLVTCSKSLLSRCLCPWGNGHGIRVRQD